MKIKDIAKTLLPDSREEQVRVVFISSILGGVAILTLGYIRGYFPEKETLIDGLKDGSFVFCLSVTSLNLAKMYFKI